MSRSMHQRISQPIVPLSLAIMLVVSLSGVTQAQDQAPRHYCASVGTDDQLRTPPPSLEGAIARLFGLKGKYALTASYYRCAKGKVLLCYVGANLPCGKADMRKSLPPADAWCHDNPNSSFIPMAVTGHDTPYNWRCVGHRAKAGPQVSKIDKRGFFAENWKELP
jgi:hypothetical protein